jgi:hypothetical protein
MAPAISAASGFYDECMKGEIRFSVGFCKPGPTSPFGHPGSFGHPGAGGSFSSIRKPGPAMMSPIAWTLTVCGREEPRLRLRRCGGRFLAGRPDNAAGFTIQVILI